MENISAPIVSPSGSTLTREKIPLVGRREHVSMYVFPALYESHSNPCASVFDHGCPDRTSAYAAKGLTTVRTEREANTNASAATNNPKDINAVTVSRRGR